MISGLVISGDWICRDKILLKKKGADVNAPAGTGSSGGTALPAAAGGGHVAVVECYCGQELT